MEEEIKLIEVRRKEALDLANTLYYKPTSPHYKDNERYAWAVKIINKRADYYRSYKSHSTTGEGTGKIKQFIYRSTTVKFKN